MACLLMKTHGASREEVDGLMAALEAQGIACYLTDAGRWRIGVDGLWLSDVADLARAEHICREFQASFAEQSRQLYRARQQSGEAVNFWSYLARQPIKAIAGVLAIAFVLGLSVLPFIRGL